ncbi:MAG TPA: hypothetical protein VFU82_02335 [Gammaproteobacteria bacterium]|jgi:hypothetical protein|nr:hypothetical protein [Gammaproteobacteria bacterium]
MTLKTVTLALLSTLTFSTTLHADELITNPNLPHPAAALKAYQNEQKTQRNQNAVKAGAAKSTTQVRPVNGRFNEVGRPGGIR